MKNKLSHLDSKGRVKMVDIGKKKITSRTASAESEVLLKPATINMILKDDIPKGNVLTTAMIAGISAAKKTSELIPLCHPLLISNVDIAFSFKRSKIIIKSKVSLDGKTGAEMEALTAVSVAALTIYDMCKSVDKEIEILNTRLIEKSGGKSGNYVRKNKK